MHSGFWGGKLKERDHLEDLRFEILFKPSMKRKGGKLIVILKLFNLGYSILKNFFKIIHHIFCIK
jgi:hypothetical protein